MCVKFRSMLAAAHVLAMDAKNLLDVVDSIRMRYPAVFKKVNPSSNSTASTPLASQQPSTSTTPVNPISSLERQFQLADIAQQSYTSQSYEQEPSGGESYQNLQQVLRHTTTPPSSLSYYEGNCDNLYSNQQQMGGGIYDNDCMISESIKSQSIGGPPKPQIAAKPPNLGQKLKSKLDKQFMDEPLKIVEDPSELYCNTATAVQLPEPVSCQIVQENLLGNNTQKTMSNKLS